MDSLVKDAIQSALDSRWEDAIRLNKKIIGYEPKNIQALNRLAFSHLQKSEPKHAVNIYKKILQIDPNNPLVERNLSKAKSASDNGSISTDNGSSNSTKPDVFINEPGKTRQVLLINTAIRSTLNSLHAGQQVEIYPRKRSVEVRTIDKIYIGALPDDISFEIKSGINNNNRFAIYIKKIEIPRIYVFIREV
jgi:tetratricopeptide (TPR) repeat protein